MFSVIVPVYKNEATLKPLLDRLDSIHEKLDRCLEVVIVVDGSPDRSYEILDEELPKRRFCSHLVLLSRNFGSFAAIRTGLAVAKGPYFAVMAADLQEPEELIVDFLRSLQNEPVDIVLGIRSSREDPLLSKWLAGVFWYVYRRFIQQSMPPGGVDVFGCNQPVRDALVQLNEANSTLVGLLVWMGYRRKLVSYRRLPRLEGKSAWGTRRRLRYMLDSAYAFSDMPIMFLTVAGLAGVCLSCVGGLVVSVAWLSGLIVIKGYTPLILTLLFSTSLLLLGMGIIGGYVWRAFENTKQRPLFLPMFHKTYEKGDPS